MKIFKLSRSVFPNLVSFPNLWFQTRKWVTGLSRWVAKKSFVPICHGFQVFEISTAVTSYFVIELYGFQYNTDQHVIVGAPHVTLGVNELK